MNHAQIIKLLEQTDLMSFAHQDTLAQLAEHCPVRILKAGEVLFEEDSIETAMYIVLAGRVLVYKGARAVAELEKGQYFGEMALIESKPRSASVRAIEHAELLEITDEDFHTYFADQPKALSAILRTLSSRIRKNLTAMTEDLQKLRIFTHDIKNNLTPLTLLRNVFEDCLAKLKLCRSEEERNNLVLELEDFVDYMAEIQVNLNSLVDQGLNQAKNIVLEHDKSDTDLLDLIKNTLPGISVHKYLKHKNILVNAREEIPHVSLNKLDIRRVLQNLIINAGYVTEKEGTIRVEVARQGDKVRVSVIDTGGGVAEEVEPYLLKEIITTKKDGNGLGLLSCKEIVCELHQGEFWYDSRPGEGCTFHFTLPIESD